jgi:hypothetical protein
MLGLLGLGLVQLLLGFTILGLAHLLLEVLISGLTSLELRRAISGILFVLLLILLHLRLWRFRECLRRFYENVRVVCSQWLLQPLSWPAVLCSGLLRSVEAWLQPVILRFLRGSSGEQIARQVIRSHQAITISFLAEVFAEVIILVAFLFEVLVVAVSSF